MMPGSRVLGLVCGLAGLALLGCGNSTSSSTPGAGGTRPGSAGSGAGKSGASSSGGGTSGGSSGSSAGGSSGGAGGLVLGDSKTEACIGYAMAVCARQYACKVGQRGCLDSVLQCPDLAFSPGSSRSVADLQACAKAYEDLPCEQVQLGILPACVTPGTRALGEACLFSSQCSSLSCDGEGQCRSCALSAHEGEPCPEGTVCSGSLRCVLGKCEVFESSLMTPKALGEDCSDATLTYCTAGLQCDVATSKCAPYPARGMSCANTRACAPGSYCDLAALTCLAFPGEGMPCGVDGSTGEGAHCADGLRCIGDSTAVGTCVKQPQAGQPCLVDAEGSWVSCDATSRCDQTTSPSTCVSKVAKGQACQEDYDCVVGTTCICPSGQVSCEARICGRLQLKGQPCTAPGDICHPGFSCSAGVCEPRDSQGLLAAACGP